MKGMSGDVNRRIFDNLSDRMGVVIAEDMEYMGPVRMSDVNKACSRILKEVISLLKNGDIVCPERDAILLFAKIFLLDEELKKREEYSKTRCEMSKLLREYLGTEMIYESKSN